MRTAWLTDVHLEFLDNARARSFFSYLDGQDAEAVLISGDIATARSLHWVLRALAEQVRAPVYFVLGNHDFYHASLATVRAAVPLWLAELPRLTWLPACGVVPLSAETALVGHDGWADGRLGNYERSDLELNDYYLIGEFKGLDRAARRAMLEALGDAAADHFRRVLPPALERFPHVVVVTHVPPFREACWHGTRPSDDNGLPHFASQAAGEAIQRALGQFPHRRVTVLCGHTHSRCDVQLAPNLRVLCGAAEYEHPTIQRVFEF